MNRSGLMLQVKVWLLRAGLLAALVGAWAWASGPGGVSRILLPSLSDTGSSLGAYLGSGGFWHSAGITVLEIAVAFFISAAGGCLLGFAASRREFGAAVLEPLLAWSYMVPLIVFYPLFILWFGVGMWSKIFYGAVSGLIPVAYNTIRGFRAVDPRYLRVGRAFGASSLQTDLLIKLGAAMPMVLAGLRIGAAINVITVILAEMLSALQGLGYDLSQAYQLLDVPGTYALIIILLVLVGIIQQGIQWATRRSQRT